MIAPRPTKPTTVNVPATAPVLSQKLVPPLLLSSEELVGGLIEGWVGVTIRVIVVASPPAPVDTDISVEGSAEGGGVTTLELLDSVVVGGIEVVEL